MQTNIIEDALALYFKERESTREHKDRLFPTQSSAYIDYVKYKKLEGRCLRASYYSCIGVKEIDEMNIDRRLTLSLGEYTEDMLINIFNRTGILVDKGVKFEIEKYHISGKLDAIVKDGDKEAGVEIKSIGSNKWTVNSIFGSPWNVSAPKWQNLFQTIVYCYAFRERLPYFLLCYIRRDNGERKTFKIAIEPIKKKLYCVIDGIVDYRYTVNDILERYALLFEFIGKDEVPPREFLKIYDKNDIKDYVRVGFISKKQAENYNTTPFGDHQCKFCGYSNQCDKDK